MTLEVRDVSVAFGPATVLDRASLHLETGEVVALLGPSGAGKTTLLRVIAGLIAPSGGTVHVDERNITELPVHRRGIGLVFQDDQLFPHLDVAGNIGFGLRMQHRSRAERDRRTAEVLRLVGLGGFAERAVSTLSGGEARRVAVARSLAPAPPILLLDEPLSGLDGDLRHRLADDLATVLRANATTVVLVTHDASEAAALADRIVHLADLSPEPPTTRSRE